MLKGPSRIRVIFASVWQNVLQLFKNTLCILSYKHLVVPVSYIFSTSFSMEKGELLALRPSRACARFIPLAAAEWWREGAVRKRLAIIILYAAG